MEVGTRGTAWSGSLPTAMDIHVMVAYSHPQACGDGVYGSVALRRGVPRDVVLATGGDTCSIIELWSVVNQLLELFATRLSSHRAALNTAGPVIINGAAVSAA